MMPVYVYTYTQILHAYAETVRATLSSLHCSNALSANSVPFSCLFPSSLRLYNNQAKDNSLYTKSISYMCVWALLFVSTVSGRHEMIGWTGRMNNIFYTKLTLLASPLSSRVRSNWRAQPHRTRVHRVSTPRAQWAGQGCLVHGEPLQVPAQEVMYLYKGFKVYTEVTVFLVKCNICIYPSQHKLSVFRWS